MNKVDQYNNMSKTILLLSVLAVLSLSCHYSCSSCSDTNYYSCTTCMPNRGVNGLPQYGMCYCDNASDEDQNGDCQASNSYNYRSKVLIVLFIALTLIISFFPIITKNMRYFLFKTIQDIQQLSLIVFFNMYFPQQFDIFLSHLYGFNISSYTFQNMAEGSLFVVLPDSSVATVDAQNIFGKYRLMHKTANFLGNQFTWIIVFVCILAAAILIKLWRWWLKRNRDFEVIKREVEGDPLKKPNQSSQQLDNISQQWYQVQRKDKNQKKCTLYSIVNKIHNMLWFNLLIVFFYFSIIEMNINIFTQIGNLTFSSDFATTGTFFSATFLALQIVVLVLLFLKAREEMVKPEWMQDYSYSPVFYLIKTNYKSMTKYFWFITCIKKILLAMMITLFYQEPLSSIIAVCIVHTIYISIAIYCEPLERKYLRAHFYITQGAKLFLFLSLINFSAKYNATVQLINLTIIFYNMLAFVFGMHLSFLILSIYIEWDSYKHYLFKRFCQEDHSECSKQRVGYRSEEKLFIYVKE